MKQEPITITDHAVIRYLERVQGHDIAAIRKEIARIAATADQHDTCLAVTSNGFRYVLRGRSVVTVVPIGFAPKNGDAP